MSVQGPVQLADPAEPHFGRNLALAAPVDLVWGFGSAFVALGPIITICLLRLGASNLLIALAPAMQTVGFSLLQLPSTHLTRRARLKKYIFVAFHLCALFWTLGGVLTLVWGQAQPRVLIWVLPLIVGLFSAGVSLAIPLWTQLLPRCFPERRKGMVSGVLLFGAGLGGMAGGLVARWALGRWPFPQNFAYLFLAAGVIMAASVLPYLFMYETAPEGAGEEEERGLGGIIRHLWREDHRLRRLVTVRYVSEFGGVGAAFLAVYALARFELPDSTAGAFALALSLGTAVGAPLLGRVGDGRGWRRGMAWGMLCVAGSFALTLGAWRPEVIYGVFVLAGIAGAADWMCYVNLLVEMSTDDRRAYYQATAATLTLPPRLVAPFVWGWLGDTVGLRPVLWACLGLMVLGWVLLLALVDDPRRPGQRVLRRSGLRPPWFTWH